MGGLLVASDIAAAREQIIDGETDVIITPRNPQAIEEAVSNLVNNPEISMAIRARGPSHVRNKFSWQRMIEEELDCLSLYAKRKRK